MALLPGAACAACAAIVKLTKIRGRIEEVPPPVEAVAAAFFTMDEERALDWLEWLLMKAREARVARRLRHGGYLFTDRFV